MKYAVAVLVLLASSTQAFVPVVPTLLRYAPKLDSSRIIDEDDFDAPADRAAAVGNMVQAKMPSVFGVEVPSFLAKAFGVRFGEGGAVHDDDMQLMMDMDEECYLGKNGDLEECADFDPPSSKP
ncbi:hypothetical protein IV203_022214 [Nitzschia inconspicua]|uniref:Uncharacterized protein n=1 Tax=Nitzschia inconspicua TaxID=303405 RepID=A0A9K3KJ43_9STRA|nr:hypothetical protein IV203_022214 [Nitzschia inconspicua]